MSSSHRNSPTERKRATGRCPTCGSRQVIRAKGDVVLRVRGRRHCFQGIEHERCQACGERIFSLDASRLFDAKILTGKRKAA
jgi:YgiT-type zinc finger domain-containing protein